jgi:hypothetical protein
VRAIAGATHDEHDLFHCRRIGGITHALVARRLTLPVARQRGS